MPTGNRKPHIAILGSGPAGLAIANVVLRHGGMATMFGDRREPSHLYGCQYLHAPLPGYEGVPSATVSYSLRGTKEQYRQKVYGEDWDGKVSPEDFSGTHEAWDIRMTYRRLWDDIIESKRVPLVPVKITPLMLKEAWWYDGNHVFDRVVSTIPAPALCRMPFDHVFSSHNVYASGSTHISAEYVPDYIQCDGTGTHGWYRQAEVFGYRTTEYPRYVPGTSLVDKPLRTDCNCFPDIIRMGRYGRWAKGILVSDVSKQAEQMMRIVNDPDSGTGIDIPPEVCPQCARWGEPTPDRHKMPDRYHCQSGHAWQHIWEAQIA